MLRMFLAGFWISFALSLGACRVLGDAHANASPSEPLQLTWLGDGSRLVVGKRWLFEPATGRFSALRCAANQGLAVHECQAKDLAFSPTGKQVFAIDGSMFAFGAPEGPVGASATIPRWVRARPDLNPSDLINVAFWLNDRSVFVQQFDREAPLSPDCRLFDTRTRVWTRPRGGCLAGGFIFLSQVHPGPKGWLLLVSGAEGYVALDFFRYNPAVGQSAAGVSSLMLEAPGPIDVRYAADGSRVELITRCVIEGDKPSLCAAVPDNARSRLYAWPTTGGDIQLQRADLPADAVREPNGRGFAWSRRDSVCVGEPTQAQARCVHLPPR